VEEHERRCVMSEVMEGVALSASELKLSDPERFQKEYWKWTARALDYDWWDSVYELAMHDGEALGFEIENINFDLYGRDASWEGEVDLLKFAKAYALEADPKWFVVLELVEDGWVSTTMSISRYGFRNTTMCVGDYWANLVKLDEDGVVGTGVFAGAGVAQLLDAVGGEAVLEEMEERVLEKANDFAHTILEMLQEEYDYLTSEEAFIEDCDINDVTFETEGEE
jgi:hypothetical protein